MQKNLKNIVHKKQKNYNDIYIIQLHIYNKIIIFYNNVNQIIKINQFKLNITKKTL